MASVKRKRNGRWRAFWKRVRAARMTIWARGRERDGHWRYVADVLGLCCVVSREP
jgi:hypothetical protein